MKIANIQMAPDIQNNKKSVEVDKDEFSKALGQAVVKSSEDTKEDEVVDLEPNDKDEIPENVLDELLVGFLSLPFMDKSISTTELNPNILDNGEEINLDARENLGLVEIVSDDIKGAVKGAVKLTEGKNPFIPEEITKEYVEQVEKSITFVNNLSLQEESLLSDTNEEAIKKISNLINNRGIESKQVKEQTESTEVVETIKPDTDLLKNLDSKEEDSGKLNKDLSSIDHSFIKEFSKTIQDIKPDLEKPLLSNDNLQRVSDTITQLLETTTEGAQVLKVKLFPEDLGTVDVTLKMEQGKLVARILVDNEQVRGLFTSSVNELSESLVKQNIQVEKINIDLNLNSNTSNNSAFDLNQGGSFDQRRSYNSKNSMNLYNSKAISKVINESNINNNGAISILA